MLTRDEAIEILNIYGKAWEKQDPDLIITIFTEDAKYHERFYEKPFSGHEGIRQYWKTKVCKEQANIKFKLLDFWIFNDTLIAEFESKFDDLAKQKRKHMKTVAILEIADGKIKSLREYWQSTEV
ncbi:MAG TPA: nuclear transport factor 2 family protein [archaeon]|nr:nuclear transport factor 2 family protein [archaeon]